MTAVTRTELSKDGYAKIEARIQEIEDTAYEGAFSDKNAVWCFQQIVSEAKKLRQTLREVLMIVPVDKTPDGKGEAV